jgi:hypothetical protein
MPIKHRKIAGWLIACASVCTAACPVAASAQRPLGTVKTEGVELTGMVAVSNGSATIGNNGAVTAGAQPSDIALTRGGLVRVCAGSQVHLSQTSMAIGRPPLMLALDRGTVEIRTGAEKTDVVLTPDLRFELSGQAPLDLRIRVVPNGDTCVDNAGKDAPMLHITETLGTGAYFVRPGQHVLFEHGSLREVVDHETSSCGCPKTDALVLAGKGKHGDGKIPEAARINPFPEAVSQGLAKPDLPQAQPAPVGVVQTQVSSTLAYNGTTNAASGPPGEVITAASIAPPAAATVSGSAQPTTATASASAPANPTTSAASTAAVATAPATDAHITEAAPPPAGPNPFRSIGHFFRRLFGGH